MIFSLFPGRPRVELSGAGLGFNIRTRIYLDNPVIRWKLFCVRIFFIQITQNYPEKYLSIWYPDNYKSEYSLNPSAGAVSSCWLIIWTNYIISLRASDPFINDDTRQNAYDLRSFAKTLLMSPKDGVYDKKKRFLNKLIQ